MALPAEFLLTRKIPHLYTHVITIVRRNERDEEKGNFDLDCEWLDNFHFIRAAGPGPRYQTLPFKVDRIGFPGKDVVVAILSDSTQLVERKSSYFPFYRVFFEEFQNFIDVGEVQLHYLFVNGCTVL
jgi:hypothetical protein